MPRAVADGAAAQPSGSWPGAAGRRTSVRSGCGGRGALRTGPQTLRCRMGSAVHGCGRARAGHGPCAVTEMRAVITAEGAESPGRQLGRGPPRRVACSSRLDRPGPEAVPVRRPGPEADTPPATRRRGSGTKTARAAWPPVSAARGGPARVPRPGPRPCAPRAPPGRPWSTGAARSCRGDGTCRRRASGVAAATDTPDPWSAGAARPGGLRGASLPRCHPFAKARPWPGTEHFEFFIFTRGGLVRGEPGGPHHFTQTPPGVCVRARVALCAYVEEGRAAYPFQRAPHSRLSPSFSSEGPPSRRQAFQDRRPHCAANARGGSVASGAWRLVRQ